jgi:hypothetical protein
MIAAVPLCTRFRWSLLSLGLAAWLASCAAPPSTDATRGDAASPPPPAAVVAPPAPPPAAPPPAPPAPPPILPYDDAVLSAANNLLGKAQLPANAGRYALVVDPLIDGVTGMQSNATQAMGAKIADLIRNRYPQYELQPFSAPNVAKSPLVLVGTFTGVNGERKTEGQREAYRICLALADLKTGKLVSKGLAFASKDGVDITPTPFFRDAPAWVEDANTTGYVRTCQGTKAGDPIHPAYLERIQSAALISEAIDAYAAGHYAEALRLYNTVAESPSGKQLRVYSGQYLTNMRLGKRAAAAEAFGQIVEQGLETKRLGVKFLFRPGSTAYWNDPKGIPTPYPIWFHEIGGRASKLQSCIEVVGHTSPNGPEPMNERLSLRRAEQVRNELLRNAKPLSKRVIASGVGSREAMIGNGRDDATDALDRRVEFKVVGC